jgi:hypothetical protein
MGTSKLFLLRLRGLEENKSSKMGVAISWITEELEAELVWWDWIKVV